MVCREDFEKVIEESRLWIEGGPNHRFLLSPEVFELDEHGASQVKTLGEALHECLSGIGRLVAIAATPGLAHGRVWNQINRIGGQDIPRIYRPLLTQKPGTVPAVCKVDLMVDKEGVFKIAEIDGHNKHGMGYSTLAAGLRAAAKPDADAFPGVAKVLAKWLVQRGGQAALIYANKERFYRPEVLVLAEAVGRFGAELVVANENEAVVDGDSVKINGRVFTNFVDLPFLDHSINKELPQVLAKGYLEGRFNFAIPPKPFLGSKAVLALLSNAEGNEELESVLRSQISFVALSTLRIHLPTTFLLTKESVSPQMLEGSSRFVLKEVVSSGMKGTLFSDDPRFPLALFQGRSSGGRFVLQEEVENRPFKFQFWNEAGELKEDNWFTRLTAHFASRTIADVVVTARRDKAVHGATDCLQLGTVLV